jgi:hypothetical protein
VYRVERPGKSPPPKANFGPILGTESEEVQTNSRPVGRQTSAMRQHYPDTMPEDRQAFAQLNKERPKYAFTISDDDIEVAGTPKKTDMAERNSTRKSREQPK